MNIHIRLKTATCFSVILLSLMAAIFALASFTKNDNPADITINSVKITGGIQAPTSMAFPEPSKIWITEQTGKIRLVKDGRLTNVVILDLKDKMIRVNSGYEERGLLNIALHPEFSSNGKFYVFYSRPATTQNPANNHKFDHTDVVAEYKLIPGTDQADEKSERIILTQDKPDGNHNGGGIVFGADGYLYVTFGDGGGQHDQHGPIGNGQNMNTWLGKVLRINIDVDSTYSVPKDNPFTGRFGTKPEIWASGFRNPYRISLDKASKQLFIGEVGQDTWEEVDILEKGANYGWRLVEGNHCHNPETGCDFTGLTPPIAEYHHSEGVSVIGGYVYNGKQVSSLKGKYLFGDWTGPVWYLQKAGNKWQRGKVRVKNFPASGKITGWGEDQSGELYYLINSEAGPGPAGSTTGSVYKIIKNQ
ncbi:sorbosone dehydrogenase family protein [Mucilaginibacter sp. UR6-11]|uniref:PQQ-dependent sugar dehydrogenase n=1 Tax=Mucilaginibacter sp. UR6-11 TaxID=1435644 RepID=UPI001E3D1B2E|nr:PQQ-dependent sugar dehydrogenase [Mucilaginibacter sp. UR6-11]MCC8426053.1 PQQ-dependent sugar dehydrogenase [Mucilaginibacter sp. UR6-11]